MPCNVYGINDNYDTNNSHFLPALIRKIVNAVEKKKNFITIWGSGKPLRELIFSDDLADACVYFMNKKTNHTLINIGTGTEKSILSYAKIIMKILNQRLLIKHENIHLDGTFRKKIDTSLAKKYGWSPKTSLEKGLKLAIKDYLKLKKSHNILNLK